VGGDEECGGLREVKKLAEKIAEIEILAGIEGFVVDGRSLVYEKGT